MLRLNTSENKAGESSSPDGCEDFILKEAFVSDPEHIAGCAIPGLGSNEIPQGQSWRDQRGKSHTTKGALCGAGGGIEDRSR